MAILFTRQSLKNNLFFLPLFILFLFCSGAKAQHTEGKALIKQLTSNDIPDYIYKLETRRESNLDFFKPDSLCSDNLSKGFKVPEGLHKFIGKPGANDNFCLMSDDSHFWGNLFYQIKSNNPHTEVNLEGWDLYHGHLIKLEEKLQNSEFAIIFHAKEFPTDYPVFPKNIRNTKKDPRLGSNTHTNDPDYHLRNYLWLSATNQIYLFNPKHKNYPEYLKPKYNQEFQTFDETFFATQVLGSIYFFPSSSSESRVFAQIY